MGDNELLIKINADAANAAKAFDDVKGKTEDLQGVLNEVGEKSAYLFAALTAEAALSIKAFGEAEQATLTLSAALQNQGIYSQELIDTYKTYAEEVGKRAGIDADQITSAQATVQAYLGQTKVTKELTQAIVDYAAFSKQDLVSVATEVGKAVEGQINPFARAGLAMNVNATEGQKLATVLDFLNTKSKDYAAASNQGVGSVKGLESSFNELQQSIGERLAPAFEAIVKSLKGFFDYLTSHPALLDFAVALGAATAAVAALGVAIPVALAAVTALTAAAAAFGTVSVVAFAGLPLILAAVGVAAKALYDNWGTVMTFLSASTKATVTEVTELLGGVGKILSGVFTLNPTKIEEGLKQVRESFAKAGADFRAIEAENTDAVVENIKKQDAAKAAAAAREEAAKRAHQALLLQLETEERQLVLLQNQGASDDLIAIKQAEIATLKALVDKSHQDQRAQLIDHLALLRGAELDAAQQSLLQEQALEDERAKLQQDFADKGIRLRADLSAKQIKDLQSTALTQKTAEQKILNDELAQRINANNEFLIEQTKYGTVSASIRKALNDSEFKQQTEANDNLVALQNSKNETLKTIGKAAAIAQITVHTAEAAINIFNGFSTIPIIGYALGIAGAAAATAFGAEQIGTVLAAADGGLVEGGIPGVDSVPALLTPGELVVPQKNFQDVVGAVQSQGEGADGPQTVNLLEQILQKIGAGATYVFQGDVLADRTYIDALTKQISDGIQYRNNRFYGVRA